MVVTQKQSLVLAGGDTKARHKRTEVEPDSFALLFITGKHATAFREPSQRAFSYPAPCRVLFHSVLIEHLRATWPNMPLVTGSLTTSRLEALL